jgi:hypothetical protein
MVSREQVLMVSVDCVCGCNHEPTWEPCRKHPKCPRWTLPEVDVGGDGAHLSSAEARIVAGMIDGFEKEYGQTCGWDPPHGAIYALGKLTGPPGAPYAHTNSKLVGVAMAEIPIPDGAWAAAGNDAVQVLKAIRAAYTDTSMGRAFIRASVHLLEGAPFIGISVVGEAWARKPGVDRDASLDDNPALRMDDVRFICAVDVDDRHYYLEHSRISGKRIAHVENLSALRERLEAVAGNAGCVGDLPAMSQELSDVVTLFHREVYR